MKREEELLGYCANERCAHLTIYSDNSDNINSLDSGLKIDESSEIHADKSTFIVFNYVF